MGEKHQNTNLASEFYILSMLYRIGANASLTLGNKKSVDIVIEKGEKVITIDVKGLRDTSIFPLDNWSKKDENHYLIFVSFLKKIDDPLCVPEIYIVPSLDIEKKFKELRGKSLLYHNPGGIKGTAPKRKGVKLSCLRKLKMKYLYKWDYFR